MYGLSAILPYMRILGIETSCDETAVCLIEAHGEFGLEFKFEVLGNALLSQAALHATYGGVFPNLAKREHAKNLVPLFEHVLKEADMLKIPTGPISGAALLPLKGILERELELFTALAAFLLRYEKPNIDCIAVTHGPGLEPALWVGVNFARALSIAWNIPLVAVNHMEGHIVMSMMEVAEVKHSNVLENTRTGGRLARFEFPLLSLLISGGHTELVLSEKFGKYQMIGRTRDDAAGEAFDKVARLLELPYPGGPHVSRLAEEARKKDLKVGLKLPRPMMHDDNFDFSFAGLKTAVRRVVEVQPPTDEQKLELAREFEDAVADVLVEKTIRAVDAYGIQTVIVGGGVSANTHIRRRLTDASTKASVKLLICPPEFSTDNALMIALASYFHALVKEFSKADSLRAEGSLRLDAMKSRKA